MKKLILDVNKDEKIKFLQKFGIKNDCLCRQKIVNNKSKSQENDQALSSPKKSSSSSRVKCLYCSKDFKNQYNMQRHSKFTHSEDPNFTEKPKCPNCEWKFEETH